MPRLTVITVERVLARLYHPPKTFLRHRTPFDLLIVTILSAQCTDVRVNEVSQKLFQKYQKPEDYVNASQRTLENVIRSTGFFHMKAKNIRALCRILLTKHGGEVPQTMAELTALPGVGRKTAAIILSVAFGKNEGIAVDTHVLRLSRRLGLTRHKDQNKVERDLMKSLPRKYWGRINPLLISHGRAICTARNRKCGKCVFQKECPSSSVMGRNDRAAR